MKLSFEQPVSLEQRAARKAAIDGTGRALRDLWKDEPTRRFHSVSYTSSLNWSRSQRNT